MFSRLAPFALSARSAFAAASTIFPARTWTGRARTRLAAATVLVSLTTAAASEAHSVAFRLGGFSPRIESDLWEDNLVTSTLDENDFDGLIGGVEVTIDISEHLDLAFGAETSSATAFTTYRDFVRDDGSEIVQDLRLRITPLTAGVRFVPLGRHHRVSPYVAGGAGVYVYEYREEGEFIDFDSFDIFGDVFIDRGVAFGGYVAGGAEVRLGGLAHLFGEFRRHWARGSHGDDFRGFGDFDLTSNELSFGVNLRF